LSLITFGKRRIRFHDERPFERAEYISYEEFRRLFDAASPQLQPVLLIGYYTGMRVNEILKLTWDKVDLSTGFIHLEHTDTKNNSARNVPINEEIVETLKSLAKVRHVSGRVFLRGGQPINSIRKPFNTAKKKAGLEKLVFHDLRGIAATNLLRAMGDQKLAMSITGHKTPAVFQRYVRVTEERQKELMDRMTKMVRHP
jgi:integrase